MLPKRRQNEKVVFWWWSYYNCLSCVNLLLIWIKTARLFSTCAHKFSIKTISENSCSSDLGIYYVYVWYIICFLCAWMFASPMSNEFVLFSCSYEFMRRNLIFYRTEIHRLTGKVRLLAAVCQPKCHTDVAAYHRFHTMKMYTVWIICTDVQYQFNMYELINEGRQFGFPSPIQTVSWLLRMIHRFLQSS